MSKTLLPRLSLAGIALALAIALPIALAGNAGFAAGGSQGKGKPAHAGKPDHAGKGGNGDRPGRSGSGYDHGSAVGDALIAATTAALIQSFFAGDLPAGYALPEPLPPGVRKNLVRGKPLPPGIAKKRLPGPLLAELPHYDGYRYYAVGRDVVLVAIATGIVVDILTDAF